MKKASGSYYTPAALADFLLSKALRHVEALQPLDVLEPSCGDGAILSAIERSGCHQRFSIDAIEVNKAAIKKAKNLIGGCGSATFYNADFLSFTPRQKYQLAIGNPPYIRRKLLKDKQRTYCRKIHTEAHLSDRAINNIWTAFLIKSAQHLTSDGVLALVLPSELLQVKFAQEVQTFLKNHFARIEIYTFKEIVFDTLGQDIVALVACRKSSEPGVYFGQVDNLSNAVTSPPTLIRSKSVETSDMKWSGYILSDSDSAFLLEIASRIKPISNYCNSCAGIVTAANDFFVLSKKKRRQYALARFCKPIVQRGQFVNGSVVFDSTAFGKILKDGKPCFLLDFTGKKLKDLNKGALRYLDCGRKASIHKRFKCVQRNRWYDVPSVWSSHAFFFKRCHLYPKLLLNTMNVLVTDAAYRVTVKREFSVSSLVFSFYNSLTLAMAELKGRFYGGGVLELTPNEFKSLPIPYMEISESDFVDFQKRFNLAGNIQKTLDGNDEAILRRVLKLMPEEIRRLQEIRKKLVERRIRGSCV